MGAIPQGLKRLVTMNKKQKLKAKGKRFGLAMPFHEPKKVGQGLFFTAGTK
ncbi:hypothetical protein [Bacillus thuringiensis]|uniref:hypothetical protein n=1 Tax=Bacillus thuringiensis TaxID=1428 RepID=UPI00345991C8